MGKRRPAKKTHVPPVRGKDERPSEENGDGSPPSEVARCGPDPTALTLRKSALALVVFAVSLAIYLRTMYPSVAGGDSTEFAFAACQFSVPHPPGYPTFLAISHAFVKLAPWGSAAARANAAAATCAAAANAVMFLAVEASTGHEPGALLATSIFGFGRLVWSYSIQSEVFALNNLFAATLLYLAARFESRPLAATAQTGAFMCGFALTNQHTIIFFVAPIVLSVLAVGRRFLFSPQQVVKLTVCVLCGMLPYLLIAWRSSYGLPGSWGNLTTVHGFLKHLLRREYGTFRLFAGAERGDNRFLLGLRRYAENLIQDFSPPGVLLLALGAALVLLRSGKIFPQGKVLPGVRISLLCWLLYTVSFHYIGNLPIEKGLYLGVHARFWLQSHVAAAQVLGVGAAGAGRAIDALASGRAADTLGAGVSSAVALLAIATQIGLNFEAMDESANRHVLEYGRELLRPLPKNARMIVKGDMVTNTARYLQVCEGYRTDIQMVDMSMMTYPWFQEMQKQNVPGFVWPNLVYHPYDSDGFSMRTFLHENLRPPHTQMYMAGGWHPEDPTPHAAFYHMPLGLVDTVVPVGKPLDFDKWLQKSRAALPKYALPSLNYTEDRWENVMVRDYYQAMHRRAHQILQWCERNGRNVTLLREAEDAMAAVVEKMPSPEGYMFRNLGVVRQMLLQTEERSDVLYASMVEAFRRYLEVASKHEPGYAAVVEVVRIHDERQRTRKKA